MVKVKGSVLHFCLLITYSLHATQDWKGRFGPPYFVSWLIYLVIILNFNPTNPPICILI